MALADNLNNYFKLHESSGDAIDAHGSSDGVIQNSCPSAAGIISNARECLYNGINDSGFNCAYNSDFDLSDKSHTIAFWYYPYDVAGNYRTLFGKDVGGYDPQLYTTPDGSIVLACQSQSAGLPANTILDDAWYFIVTRLNIPAFAWTLRVNDSVTIDTFGGAQTPINAPFRIGLGDGAQYPAQGRLCEFGIWHRSLSDAEITELYNDGAGRSYEYVTGGGAAFIARPNARQIQAINRASRW